MKRSCLLFSLLFFLGCSNGNWLLKRSPDDHLISCYEERTKEGARYKALAMSLFLGGPLGGALHIIGGGLDGATYDKETEDIKKELERRGYKFQDGKWAK